MDDRMTTANDVDQNNGGDRTFAIFGYRDASRASLILSVAKIPFEVTKVDRLDGVRLHQSASDGGDRHAGARSVMNAAWITAHTFRPGIDHRCTHRVLIPSPLAGGLMAAPCGRPSHEHAYTPLRGQLWGPASPSHVAHVPDRLPERADWPPRGSVDDAAIDEALTESEQRLMDGNR